MNPESKKLVSLALVVVLVILLISSVSMLGQIGTLKTKVNQMTLIVGERDKQIEADKALYVALAARLHQELKKQAR